MIKLSPERAFRFFNTEYSSYFQQNKKLKLLHLLQLLLTLLFEMSSCLVLGGNGNGNDVNPAPEQFTCAERTGDCPITTSKTSGRQVQFFMQFLSN